MGVKLLTGSVLAVIGFYTVKLLFAVLAGVVSFVGFLVFTVLPILLLGWLTLKIIAKLKEKPAA